MRVREKLPAWIRGVMSDEGDGMRGWAPVEDGLRRFFEDKEG